jgi:membrane-associated PAP2 superfamily phosphatase
MPRVPARLPLPAATLLVLLTLLAWDASGADLSLARLAGSPAGFPWRDHWLLAGVLHAGGRWAAWVLALALCVGVGRPWGPLAALPAARRAQLALTVLAGVAVVSVLKAASATSCPWDLQPFGGPARLVSHWSQLADGGAGRCFPAGHASAGFAFLGGYFAFRSTQPRLARAWLLGAIGAGLALGLAQQWRGAHFMSHTLWTGFICWCVAWGIDAGVGRRTCEA